MNEIFKLIIFSSSAVIILFVISKILGKKQIAQLEFIDYVIGISIGSIAAEMATDLNETPFYYYIIGMAIFFIFDISITFLGRKSPFLKTFLKGKPTVIIYNGKINYKLLKKSKLDINDLLELCRDKNYFDINEIAFAIFESNGKLSIMPKSENQIPTLNDLKIKTKDAQLPNYLVADGHISYSGLNKIHKDTKWLFKMLEITNKKELKNIILASFDSEKNKIDIHYK